MADLFHRVSIRKYQDRPVEKEKIMEILRAAMAAPSAKNQQPWEFYVITKKRYTGKVIKGKSVCRDDSECTGGNRISISERLCSSMLCGY